MLGSIFVVNLGNHTKGTLLSVLTKNSSVFINLIQEKIMKCKTSVCRKR